MSKSAEAFRTISEVAEVLDTPAHVLRFWESRFSQIKPVKRAGGRRYYRPSDIALLGGIRRLLHEDGLTIRGVQKILREKGVKHVASLSGETFDLAETDVAVPEAVVVETPVKEPGAALAEIVRPAFSPATRATPSQPEPDLFEAVSTAPAPEAPMMVDAPALPEATAAQATPMRPPGAEADRRVVDVTQVAALLRRMDPARAESLRPELQRLHDRLSALRDRLVQLG